MSDTPGVARPHITQAKKKKNKGTKRYALKMPNNISKFPSIDEFKLDKMLSGPLKEETEELVEALLNSSTKYRLDLKAEVRRKLSTEQRIQTLNISIAKIIYELNHNLNIKLKKVGKALENDGGSVIYSTGSNNNAGNKSQARTSLETEINKLSEVSSKANVALKSIISRIIGLEKGDKASKFPTISNEKYPLLSKLIVSSPEEISTANEANVSSSKLMSVKSNSIENKINELSIHDNSASTEVTKGQTNKAEFSKSTMDSIEFEAFMSSAIEAYREKQGKKYNDKAFSLQEGSNSKANLSRPIIRNISLGKLSPLDLLCPDLPFDSASSDNTLSNMLLKSAASPKQTFQSSLHKKLRISSFPVVPKSKDEIDEEDACKFLNQLDECLSNEEDNSGILALEDSNDNDDNMKTFGNYEFYEEQLFSSESSDWDSSSSNEGNLSISDEYYSKLKASMKETLKKKHAAIREKNAKLTALRIRDLSPTPKHKPSHYKLKPKKSILKLSVNSRHKNGLQRTKSPIKIASSALSPSIPFQKYLSQLRKTSSGVISDLTVEGEMVSPSIPQGTILPTTGNSQRSLYSDEPNEPVDKSNSLKALKYLLESD